MRRWKGVFFRDKKVILTKLGAIRHRRSHRARLGRPHRAFGMLATVVPKKDPLPPPTCCEIGATKTKIKPVIETPVPSVHTQSMAKQIPATMKMGSKLIIAARYYYCCVQSMPMMSPHPIDTTSSKFPWRGERFQRVEIEFLAH